MYQSIHASTSDKKDDRSKSTENHILESPDKPKTTPESNTSEKKESCNQNGSSKPNESENSKKLEEDQALDDALKELNKALERYEEAKKKVDNRINSIKKNVESSSSKIARSASSIPVSYSIYNSPTSYVSRMLNQNYVNQHLQYQRGRRRML